MKQFSFDGHTIAYEESGSGEPLVFLHNGGTDHRIWEHQIAHFSQNYQVFAFDHLGFGESDKPRVELPLSLFSNAVAAFVDGMAFGQVNLVGNCMGSAMAFDYTLHHPDKVRRLVLCNITSQQILCDGPLKDVYQEYSRDPQARETFIAGIEAKGMTRKQTDRFLRSLYGATAPEDTAFADHMFELCNRPGQMRSLYVVLSNFDHYTSPDSFEKPANFPATCVIWGKENYILPLASGERFCDRAQPQRAEFLDGCGHLLMREKPQETNRIIESFLQ